MALLKWIVIASAVLNFGFMTFDGTRGLTIGDYVRPRSGEFAGQLGPWTKIVKSVGIDPESTLMKVIFLIWGLFGLTITVCFFMNLDWSWKAMLFINICTLWYLVPGTGLSALQIVLLILRRFAK